MARPQNKEEFRKQMAEQFARVLEEKGAAWKQEWAGGMSAPRNGVTNGQYHGTNAFWLSLVSMAEHYTDQRWVTSIQVNDVKHRYHPGEHWHIKAGSKATYIEYWYPLEKNEFKAYTWPEYREALRNGKSENDFSLTVRYTPVFNANQIEGMKPIEKTEINPDVTMDELVKKLSEEMQVEILTDGGDKAYYSGVQDKIHLPDPTSFTDEYAFNSTALHELSHATGHKTRLDRPMSNFFGSDGYAYEELIAEICSCFMGADLQIMPTEEQIGNHMNYVRSWVQEIRKDPDILVKAIRDAQKAANYMEVKAGMLPEKEYEKMECNIVEMKPKERSFDMER